MPQSRIRKKKRRRSKAAAHSHKKSGIGAPIIVAVIIGALVIAGTVYLISQNVSAPSPAPPAAPTATTEPVTLNEEGMIATPSGLKYKDIVEGTGVSPKAGQTITVHYTGLLANGEKFDSSRDRGQPIDFVIGKGAVIKGWDEGVITMKIGGKRKLIIPPDLGYGAQGRPPSIPPNSTLLFEVELIGVK